MYFTEIQKIMGLLWTLYVNKLNNYKKKIRNVQLTNTVTGKKDKKNLNRIITSKETELTIKNFQTEKSPGLEWLHWWILSKFKEKLTLLLKLFQKNWQEWNITNSFYKASITQIPKWENDATRKLNQYPWRQ